MLLDAHSPEHAARRRSALLARLLGCVVFALFAGCYTSAAALGATSPETTSAVPEAPPTGLAGTQGTPAPIAGEAPSAGSTAPGSTQGGGASSAPSGAAGSSGSGGGGTSGEVSPSTPAEGPIPAPGPGGPSPAGEGATTPGGPGVSRGGTPSEPDPGAPVGPGGSSGIETLAPHQGTGDVQQPVPTGPGGTSGGGSASSGEGGSPASAGGSGPPPSGGGPGAAGATAQTPASAAVPPQIATATISKSPFTPELERALAGIQAPGPGGTAARVVVAKVPAAGSLTLSCLTRSRTVHCELLIARQDPGRLVLTYAGSASVHPPGQPLAPTLDNDHFNPPPAVGGGLPGSDELVGGSSSAASAASGGTAAAMLIIGGLFLLASPLILRRLLDVCERWLASPLDLVLERPD
jgi:hypothetical protein